MDGIQREDIENPEDLETVQRWFTGIDTETPKALLMFDMNSQEFKDATNGWKYNCVIYDLDQWLRNQLKYHRLPPSMAKGFEFVRKKMREIHNNYNIVME